MSNIYKVIGKTFVAGMVFVPAVTASCIITAGVVRGVGRYLERNK